MRLLDYLHNAYSYNRRVRTLSNHFAALIPRNTHVLDVGCGDGLLAHLITQSRADVHLRGIDVLVRDQTHIPVDQFDGQVIPYGDTSFDVVMFADVLHHTEDPMCLLREAARVARLAIVIKDHMLNGRLAGPTLRFMDRVGNARYGVALPYHYWLYEEWLGAFRSLNLTIGLWKQDLRLYPRPLDWVFGRSLHFIAKIDLP